MFTLTLILVINSILSGASVFVQENIMREISGKNSLSQGFIIAQDYQPVSLSWLIGVSDLIASGQVIEVRESDFVFNIEFILWGNTDKKNITVCKYIPVAFNESRQVPYQTEQAFILFMKKCQNDEQEYEIIGLGGEGEIPVENGYVYFRGLVIEGLERVQSQVHGKNSYLQYFDYDTFTDAVNYYRKCFSWLSTEEIRNNKKRTVWYSVVECPDETIEAYQGKSWIHNYLVEETRKTVRNGNIE